MKRLDQTFLANLSFRQQLVLAFSVGIVALTILSSIAIATLSSRIARDTLVEQGQQATEGLAAQSTLGLLYWSPENAESAVQEIMAFPNMRGAGIYGPERDALLTRGDIPTPLPRDFPIPEAARLEHESDDAWYFVAPVFTGGDQSAQAGSPFEVDHPKPELLGFVRVVQGKDTLKTMAVGIWRGNVIVSIVLALVLLVVLLTITRRVTRPLKELAETMRRAQDGDDRVRANLRGPRDILHMEQAFNTMMEVLDAREDELERARDAALESARLKGEFAANVSHELRTPLNGVLGMLELLSDMGLTQKQREYAEVARSSGESLLGLVDDILDFSKLSAGKLQTDPVAWSVEEMFDDAIQLAGARARDKGLDLAYFVAPSVPKLLVGEPGRIRQILMNLLGNAVKFTEAGSVELSATAEEGGGDRIELRVEVKDTGIGIVPEARERIFDAFTQADGTTTRKYGGTGLGLAISRQLVELMGGRLGVESELGLGSTFWFTLPLERGGREDAESGFSTEPITDLSVLVVESSETQSRFLAQFLDRWGIEHEMVASVAEARERLRTAADAEEKPFDGILVDQDRMRGLTSQDVLQQLESDGLLEGVPAIVMGYQAPALSQDRQGKNRIPWVAKPIRASVLYEALSGLRSSLDMDTPEFEMLGTEESPTFLGSNVLVAEDNRASQQVVAGMLRRLGCTVTVVSDGQETLTEVVRGTFDLVLMDCHMPNVDGFEATARIRNLEAGKSRIPIIALTANVQQTERDRCLAAGMDDFIPKPLKLQSIRETLQKWYKAPEHGEETGASEPRRDSHIDPRVLGELREAIGDGFSPMIALFLEDTPEHLRALREAIENKQSERVVEYAHSVKGAARNLGAERLAALAKQLEDAGRQGVLVGQVTVAERAFEEFEEVRAVLDHEIHPDRAKWTEQAQSGGSVVLVVDDDRGARFALRKVLEEDGYQVDEASDGSFALAMCERRLPALVLVDAMMPVLDGFSTCSRIRELPGGRDIPILMVTALDDEDSIVRAFSAGATDYVSKPVHLAVLRQRVNRLLQTAEAQTHIRKLAYHDPLTGLPNRIMFRERFNEAISKTPTESVALLFVDLDRFKLVNDSFGHEVGDLLLKAVADRLLRCVRGRDLVARFGGDEFTVVLNRLKHTDNAAAIAKKIAAALAGPFVFMGHEVFISASIGIVIAPRDGDDVGTLVKHADTAMFRAKAEQSAYKFYEPHMADMVSTRLRTESELRRALERDEFVWYYQPIINVRTGRVVALEALIRWFHPERGLMLPYDFVPVAEETGLIREIGMKTIDAAFQQLQDWGGAEFGELTMAVNISSLELDTPEFVDNVRDLLARYPKLQGRIEFEITESTVMERPDEVAAQLGELRAMGIRIAIDDFGTGYSSLGYLKKLPLDKLKIDRSFVDGIPGDGDDITIVNSILALATSLGLSVVAEGIETKAQVEFFEQTNCAYMQGYFFGKPMEPEALKKWLLTVDAERRRKGDA